MSTELIIAGALVLIFGIAAIVYAVSFYRERGYHQDTKAALEICRDSLRRVQSKADDLEHKVWEHPSELTKAEREARRKLAEEIRDAEVEAAEAIIEELNGRQATVNELHEAGAIDDGAFWMRSEELRNQIEEQEARISEARQKACSRIGFGSLFIPYSDWV